MKKDTLMLSVSALLCIVEIWVFTDFFNSQITSSTPWVMLIFFLFSSLLLLPSFAKWKENEEGKNFFICLVGVSHLAILIVCIPETNQLNCIPSTTNPKGMVCTAMTNVEITMSNIFKNMLCILVPAWFIHEITKEEKEKDNAADKPDNNIENELNTAIEIWLQGKENAEKLAEENFEKESRWESISHTKKSSFSKKRYQENPYPNHQNFRKIKK